MIGVADSLGAALLFFLVQRELKVGAEWFGEFLAPEIGDGAARNPIYQLPIQDPDGERVVGRLLAGRPCRRLTLGGGAQSGEVGEAAALESIQEHEPRGV